MFNIDANKSKDVQLTLKCIHVSSFASERYVDTRGSSKFAGIETFAWVRNKVSRVKHIFL